jgi:hypothetical protein
MARRKSVFQMPKPMSIMGRTSSITNSFINGIIPVIEPTEEEVLEALQILGLNPEDLQCAYCGDRATEWDHLRPLVINQRPTGYISEIANLVPACGKCNQSKGNKAWHAWMISNAVLSPKSRNTPNLEERMERLHAFENWRSIYPINIEAIVGSEIWEAYWQNWVHLLEEMRTSQRLSAVIRDLIRNYRKSNEP